MHSFVPAPSPMLTRTSRHHHHRDRLGCPTRLCIVLGRVSSPIHPSNTTTWPVNRTSCRSLQLLCMSWVGCFSWFIASWLYSNDVHPHGSRSSCSSVHCTRSTCDCWFTGVIVCRCIGSSSSSSCASTDWWVSLFSRSSVIPLTNEGGWLEWIGWPDFIALGNFKILEQRNLQVFPILSSNFKKNSN